MTTILFCAVAICSSAQKLKVEKLTDEPNFSNLAIRPAMTIDLGLKAGWGAGVGIDAEYSNSSLPVQFRLSFLQNLIGSQNIGTEHKPLRGVELGTAYPLINKNTKKSLSVILKSTKVSSTSTTETYNITSTNHEGTVNKQILARGGFYSHRSNWESSDVGDGNPILINGSSAFMKGNTNVVGVYTGIGIQTRKNLVLDTDIYGQARRTAHSQFYLDLLIAPSVGLGEWTDTQGFVGATGTTYDMGTESTAETKNLGWRFGWIANPVNSGSKNPNGWYFKFETGSRPAMKGQGAFFISYIGYAFNKG